MDAKVQLIQRDSFYTVLVFDNSNDLRPKTETEYPFRLSPKESQYKAAKEYGRVRARGLGVELEDLTDNTLEDQQNTQFTYKTPFYVSKLRTRYIARSSHILMCERDF